MSCNAGAHSASQTSTTGIYIYLIYQGGREGGREGERESRAANDDIFAVKEQLQAFVCIECGVCVREREKERERERERVVYYNIYTMNSKDRKNSKKMRK